MEMCPENAKIVRDALMDDARGGKRNDAREKADRLATKGLFNYFQGVEDGLSPAFLALSINLDADHEGPARPRPLYLKRDAYRQLPHRIHSLYDSEADATAGRAQLSRSRRLARRCCFCRRMPILFHHLQLLATGSAT
jgi:hypothetical protein